MKPEPILFGMTSARPNPRYLWLIPRPTGENPVLRVHKSYPVESGPLLNVRYREPRGWIEMPHEFALACGVPKVDLGWSDDGHHWVLFGLSQYTPLHVQVCNTFPEVLRAIFNEATTTDPRTNQILERLRAAYQRSS